MERQQQQIQRKQQRTRWLKRGVVMVGGAAVLIGLGVFIARKYRERQIREAHLIARRRTNLLYSGATFYLRDRDGNYLSVSENGGTLILRPNQLTAFQIRSFQNETGEVMYTITSAVPVIDSISRSFHTMNVSAKDDGAFVSLSNTVSSAETFTILPIAIVKGTTYPYFTFVNRQGLYLGSTTYGPKGQLSIMASRSQPVELTPIAVDDIHELTFTVPAGGNVEIMNGFAGSQTESL